MKHHFFRHTTARSCTLRTSQQRATALLASPLHGVSWPPTTTVWAAKSAGLSSANNEAKFMRWFFSQGFSSFTHRLNAFKDMAFEIFMLSSIRHDDGNEVNDAAGVKPNDAATWPIYWDAADIEQFLSSKISKPKNVPDWDSLASLLRTRDITSLNILLCACVKSPPPKKVMLDVSDYSTQNFQVNSARSKELETHFEKTVGALSNKEGSEGRNIALWPRGNMQLLKQFIHTHYFHALMCGRVLVRPCAQYAKLGSSWLNLAMAGTALPSMPASETYSPPHAGMCELIRAHVETVTGSPQDPTKYCDTRTAYATWMSETERCFSIPSDKKGVGPLIVLGSCEMLAQYHHRSLVHKCSGKPYTLLEAFCLGVPAPHSILLSGSNVEFNSTDPVYLGLANVSVLPFDSTALRNG